jgi:hypothetical protein
LEEGSDIKMKKLKKGRPQLHGPGLVWDIKHICRDTRNSEKNIERK